MGKPPVSQPKEKPPSSNDGSNGGSPVILILAVLSIIAVGLFLFKDKIFKKKDIKNLSDIKQEEPPKEEPTEPETLEGSEAQEANDKFAKLS